LQSVDFVQMFQSMIIFWLPLVFAALILYLKTAAIRCVNHINRLVEVFCIFGKILILEVSDHFYRTFCRSFNLVMFQVCSNYLTLY